jgi:cytochrome c556
MRISSTGTATFAGQVLTTAGSGVANAFKPGLSFTGDDNTGIMQQAGADTLTFVTAGREAITIDAIQHVKFKQQIQASSQAAVGIPMYAFDGDPDTGIGRAGQDILALITAGSQRVQVSAAGNVSIGTSSDNGNRLQVAGQIWSTSGTIATSDAKFKANVEALTDATSVVERLRPVAFDFIKQPDREFSTDRQVGLIAQEAQAALAGTDYADSVVSQCGDHLGLSYERLVPVLIRALQESNARIAALERKWSHA